MYCLFLAKHLCWLYFFEENSFNILDLCSLCHVTEATHFLLAILLYEWNEVRNKQASILQHILLLRQQVSNIIFTCVYPVLSNPIETNGTGVNVKYSSSEHTPSCITNIEGLFVSCQNLSLVNIYIRIAWKVCP